MSKLKVILVATLLFATLFTLKSCKKKAVKGCMDKTATNYNANATEDDGSCTYAAKTVGQSYGGGIVFYVDATGQHGLIAATADQGNSRLWLNTLVIATGATGTAIGTGQSNTNAIVAIHGAGNYAAKVCDDLVSGGFSDWFLPSKDELNLMYTNLFKKGVGNFAFARYWSSSEVDVNNALCLEFNTGLISPLDKINAISARAARVF